MPRTEGRNTNNYTHYRSNGGYPSDGVPLLATNTSQAGAYCSVIMCLFTPSLGGWSDGRYGPDRGSFGCSVEEIYLWARSHSVAVAHILNIEWTREDEWTQGNHLWTSLNNNWLNRIFSTVWSKQSLTNRNIVAKWLVCQLNGIFSTVCTKILSRKREKCCETTACPVI